MKQVITQKKTFIPILLWILYLATFHISNYVILGYPYHYLPTILSYGLMTVLVVIVGVYILPSFYETKKFALLSFSIIVLYFVYVFCAYLIEGVLENKYYGNNNPNIHIKDYFISCLTYFVFYTIVGTAYYFAAFAGRKESEILKIEMAFLRAQINPHFLLNTFTSLQNEAEKTDVNLANRITRLGKMMHYNLMKTGDDGKMPLAKEVEHIENEIAFYRDRYNDKVYIEFQHPVIPERLRIPPLILVTLVENALKHGEFTNPEKPIVISLQLGAGMLFTVQNYKRKGPPDMSTSVGLNNLRRRLELMYSKKNFDLNIQQDEATYFTELSITL
jgi:two-component system, LytTR family, sensor kinase